MTLKEELEKLFEEYLIDVDFTSQEAVDKVLLLFEKYKNKEN